MIAGKIIPTILTTTATIAGHVSLQLFTLLQTHEIKYLRNLFFNLANNYYLFQEPSPPIKIEDKSPNDEGGPSKAIPEGWNTWDKLEIKGSKTCQELFNYLLEKYNITIDFLIANGKIIISSMDEEAYEQNKNRKIEILYSETTNVNLNDINYILLQVVANIKKTTIKGQELEDVSVEMPPIKYYFDK